MEQWKHINLSDDIGAGITEEGYQFIEIDIEAWNDDENFSDFKTIVSVRATELDENIEVTVLSDFEQIAENPRVKELIEEAIEVLQEETRVHFSD
ncbi:hypothetical protein JFV29_12400 [Peribacillus sp. TH16]|uniref:hypothetical protein n=1 Tax=Peribacillus sp. TH16 TaxID=2798482 RepID=UPI00191483FF|nr:hypothetical protein [Peribacillus sp. TH16]MBK5482683.1 hypothetical protein [Peribacillus sp. TH16]